MSSMKHDEISIEYNDVLRPSLVDQFHYMVQSNPDKSIIEFINDRGYVTHDMTGGMLDASAQLIAKFLVEQQNVRVGDRVIILCDPGIDFVVTFFGVVYAGAVAVPCYPPMNEKQFLKLFRIGRDCNAKTIVLSADFYNMISSSIPELEIEMQLGPDEKINWLSLGEIPSLDTIVSKTPDFDLVRKIVPEFQRPDLKADDIAFLQYSSGSTGEPKGVVVTHRNILNHITGIATAFGYSKDTNHICVTWLPPYHDMGLIGALLTCSLAYQKNYILSPITFVLNPFVWLEIVSRSKATITGGPNFAFDYCVNRVSDEQVQKLDLSHLKLCYTGAEPIRLATMKRFAEKFKPAGFKFDIFYPCYGLAEATLRVCGKKDSSEPVAYLAVDRDEFQKHNIVLREEAAENTQILVSSGYPKIGQPTEIVDPETRRVKKPYEIGEIWIYRNDGTPIAYWNNEELTRATFYAEIENDSTHKFIRTGDLGFADDEGRLYVCGRIKDLIILRGKNVYPQDVEAIVDSSSTLIRTGCTAAFGIDAESTEELVVVTEVKDVTAKDTEKHEEIFKAIRRNVSEELQIQVHTIILIKQKTIPKTTSGKIRRFETKQLMLDNKLELVATSYVAQPVEKTRLSVDEVTTQLVQRIALVLEVSPHTIDIHLPFTEQGLDSLKTSKLVGELSQILNREISPTLFFEFPTIYALARNLSGQASSHSKSSTRSTVNKNEDIAIVGISCRLPGADGVEQFWDNLLAGINAPSSVYPKYRSKKSVPAALINNAFNFDSEFFSISKREAKTMDPQQRILLEVCWEAIEDAGETLERISGSKLGVFIGAASFDFALESYKHARAASLHSATGSSLSILANRLSYVLNCHGPSMVLDSACSSSLLAVHQACQSIRSGESDAAIAGGINLLLGDNVSQALKHANFLSPDGQCKAFDADANGYVRGEGCGVVFLKPLSKALADNDIVYAVVKGSAVVQDGRSNGLTAPNQQAQERVIRDACSNAGVSPSELTFVECHGTGTYLGDPIEALALGNVVGPSRSKPCLIGSVKSNVGHLEAASGMAALIKTALALHYKQLPPTVNLQTPNPLIQFDKLNLKLALTEQTLAGDKLLAGVSNFGFGGTNVHLIAESFRSATPETTSEKPSRELLFPISARSEKSLKHLVGKYINYLQVVSVESEQKFLSDLSYTLLYRRTQFSHRLCVSASSLAGLTQELIKHRSGKDSAMVKKGVLNQSLSEPSVVFVFPGQGTDHVSQAKSLLNVDLFKNHLLKVEDAFKQLSPDINLVNVIEKYQDFKDNLLAVQAVMFAVQVSLAAYWQALDIKASAVVGHSLGEISAAYVAGALTLADAASIIYHRSILLQERLKGKGKMLIARISLENAQQIVASIHDVSIAAVNSANSITFAGSVQQIQVVQNLLNETQVSNKYLDLDYAFHSHQVAEVSGDLLLQLKNLKPLKPQIPVYSTSKQCLVTSKDTLVFDAEYWVDNLAKAVYFGPSIEAILNAQPAGTVVFLEMACRDVLSPTIHQIILTHSPTQHSKAITSISKSNASLTAPLALLYVSGYALNWRKIFGEAIGSNFLKIPNYCWNAHPFVPEFINKHDETKMLNVDEVLQNITTASKLSVISVKEFAALMDELCITYILYALSKLGWSHQYNIDNVVTASRAIEDLGVTTDHQTLFLHVLRELAKQGYLEDAGENTYRVLQVFPTAQELFDMSEKLLVTGKDKYPEFLAEFSMVERSGKDLHNVLRGTLTGLQILFPNGSMENTEELYERSALSKQYNDQVCLFFDQAMQSISKIDTNSKYRQKVLEIGAGTGGLTSHVLETLSRELENSNTKDLTTATVHEYVFTDISKVFLAHAKHKFASCSYMKYALLDIEKSPSTQGFTKHSYDFVLAANVLHATMNLSLTLKNIKDLLKPGGVLVILEVTRPTLFLDLTFGLLDGWWRFNQNGKQDLRNEYPLLNWNQWRELLTESGFTSVNRVSSDNSTEEFQSVMIAQLVEVDDEIEDTVSDSPYIRNTGVPILDDKTVEELKQLIANIDRNEESQLALFYSSIQSFIKTIVAQTLFIAVEDLDVDLSLESLGVDSLLGLELRNLIQTNLNIKIPLTALMSENNASVTVSVLARNLGHSILHASDPAAAQSTDVRKDEEVQEFFEENAVDELLSTAYNNSTSGSKACILAMGVATPKYKYSQHEMAEFAVDYYNLNDNQKEKEKLLKIFEGSDISTRYSVVDMKTLDKDKVFNSFQARNEIYEVEAVELAVQSTTRALDEWGGDRKAITHIVSVSTTGNKIPGIEFELVHRLGLSPHVERIAVNFMGCFGALPGLKTASSFAQLNSKNRVLFVSTEICSTHVEKEPTAENFVGTAIFADGSAAAVIGCGDPEFEPFEKPHFEVVKTTSFAINNSLDKMYWKVTDSGWRLGLSKDIPDLIFKNIEAFTKEMLGTKYGSVANIPKLNADWAIHPGGKAILVAVENALDLNKEQTKYSWRIMRDHGNMSSSTILHVLEAMIKDERNNSSMSEECRPLVNCLVFGPGLTMEGAILRRIM